MKRGRVCLAAAVVALGALAGCSGHQQTSDNVQSPPAGAQPVLRQVHSPGKVTDDLTMLLLPGQCHVQQATQGEPLPDRYCTPGAIDPAVTQDNLKITICKIGYTATVRPPAADTGHYKRISESDYGDTATFVGEYDHLVPLELGGANSTSNLWPEAGVIPNAKDKVENNLHAAVCAGRIGLHQAQEEIALDWTTAKW